MLKPDDELATRLTAAAVHAGVRGDLTENLDDVVCREASVQHHPYRRPYLPDLIHRTGESPLPHPPAACPSRYRRRGPSRRHRPRGDCVEGRAAVHASPTTGRRTSAILLATVSRASTGPIGFFHGHWNTHEPSSPCR